MHALTEWHAEAPYVIRKNIFASNCPYRNKAATICDLPYNKVLAKPMADPLPQGAGSK